MKLTYTFKHMQASESLVEYAQQKLEKLSRYELKPYHVSLSFSMRRHERHCDILVTGPDVTFRASAQSDEIYESVDLALDKLQRQLDRRKGRIQHHKLKELTQEAHLERLNESFEEDLSLISGAGKRVS